MIRNLFAFGAMLVLAFAGSAQARATKDNVGTQLGEIDVKYLDKQPEGALAGKPMVVEFWATWCPPCRTSIPHLNAIHDKFKDKGLIVIGITDEDKKEVRDFRKEVPMNYLVATDEKARLKESLGINAIPHAVVVDKTGKIVWEGHPMQLKDSTIESVLK